MSLLSAAIMNALQAAVLGRADPRPAIPATVYPEAWVGTSAMAGTRGSGIANDQTSFPAVSAGNPTVNGIAISLPAGNYNGVTVIRFYDASSGGNEVFRSAAFTAISHPGTNAALHCPIGSLSFTVSS
jgi:hypothetical protein